MRTDIQSWLNSAVTQLQGITNLPLLECHALLSYELGKPREWIIANADAELSQEQIRQLDTHLQKLIQGTPLPYITGIQAFYGLDFGVTPDVLIPRPETELLVEEAVTWLHHHPDRRSVLDMGTGSGAIAVTLADQVPDLMVTAIDRSAPALDVARQNAEKFQVGDRVTFIQSDLFSSVNNSFDVIAANLPYIPSAKLDSLPVVKFEPRSALDGGTDGLDLIRRFIIQASTAIRPGGLILVEIEAVQSDAALKLAQNTFAAGTIRLLRDYAGYPRLILIQAS